MSKHIPYGHHSINEHDIERVVEVLRSDWLTQGPLVPEFEKLIAEYCGVQYAVAVANGTMALHLACLAAGMSEDDLLWTSPNTFVASANCGLYCGGCVDFVDIDPRTYNMSVKALEQKLIESEKRKTIPSVIVPVHFSGQSCEMEAVSSLASKFGIKTIEDACHALGGQYKGKPVGACTFSDMAVFSLHPVKIITSGEGGVVVTNCKELYDKLCLLRVHGITRDENRMDGASHGPWYYQQIELGFNYRMSDIQAALGISQLERIDDFILRRRKLAGRYEERLGHLPIVLPFQHPDVNSSFHLYVIRLKLNEITKSKQEIFQIMRGLDIGVNLHYIPVHTHPYYQRMGFKNGDYPESERYYEEAMSLPIYYDLTDDDQDRVISGLEEALL